MELPQVLLLLLLLLPDPPILVQGRSALLLLLLLRLLPEPPILVLGRSIGGSGSRAPNTSARQECSFAGVLALLGSYNLQSLLDP